MIGFRGEVCNPSFIAGANPAQEVITVIVIPLQKFQEMASWKINEKGEYKPFFGYTIISMIDDPENQLQNIEEYISSSVISQYYAPLPHCTYHMTLYNIYPFNKDPIPPVKKWLLAENETVPKQAFLPEKVLKYHHAAAVEAIKKHLGENSLKIENVSLEISGVIKIKIELSTGQESILKSLREDLAKIYENPDANLKFHLTLAYLYKPIQSMNSDKVLEDLEHLKELVQKFKGFELKRHNVYLFDSMINFMPIESVHPLF
ncbi:hypothetical protein FQR65_LT12008 [Abscondita terminalis]|nr:hypothetical protein FQR65_LT12008 [Abscondita terminalis]